MNRLIRVIFLNLLNFFDINKIIIARNNNVKSEFESKAVIAVATGLLYGYIIYRLFIKLQVVPHLDHELIYICTCPFSITTEKI